MDKLKEKIKYINKQLSLANGNGGWVVEGMKEELRRLETKLNKKQKSKKSQ